MVKKGLLQFDAINDLTEKIIFDFDGIFTDNNVLINQDGIETVKCSRADGLGLDILKKFIDKKNWNLDYFILSTEKNPVVMSRAKKLKIKLGDFVVAENGKISDSYNEEKLKEYMKWDSIKIEINLNQGSDTFECYTCDFTHDYIDINADYRN